ncbi:MAG: Ldh family oxidoreductase, partial [Gammaproteobacteria bacterium]|nr:Ldh family oxidoreductase [Gammaproteobacteria bacterium]
STPPASGFSEVYYPGEVEHLRKKERLAKGVEIEDATWEKLGQLAGKLGLPAIQA